jgi:NAD(P)-dependent dehydrogenase (short-subunit alcohol dehydrogenase family)
MPQVNNASVQGAAVDDLREISRKRLERTFNTNVIAMFNLVQARQLHTHRVTC